MVVDRTTDMKGQESGVKEEGPEGTTESRHSFLIFQTPPKLFLLEICTPLVFNPRPGYKNRIFRQTYICFFSASSSLLFFPPAFISHYER
jgi:hypothetical protein